MSKLVFCGFITLEDVSSHTILSWTYELFSNFFSSVGKDKEQSTVDQTVQTWDMVLKGNSREVLIWSPSTCVKQNLMVCTHRCFLVCFQKVWGRDVFPIIINYKWWVQITWNICFLLGQTLRFWFLQKSWDKIEHWKCSTLVKEILVILYDFYQVGVMVWIFLYMCCWSGYYSLNVTLKLELNICWR